MKISSPVSLFLLFFIGFLSVAPPASAAQTELTLAKIQEMIAKIKSKSGLDEKFQIRVLNAYYAAEDNLEELQSFIQKIELVQKELNELPSDNKKLEKQIAEAELKLKSRKPEKFSLYSTEDLEQRQIIEKSKLNSLQSEIARLETQLADQLNRPQKTREKLAILKNSQEDTQQEQTSLVASVQNELELDARQIQLDTRSRKLNKNITWLELENIVHPLRNESLKLQLQLLNLEAAFQSSLIKEIENNLMTRRQQDIDQAQSDWQQAQKDAAGKHSVIQELTWENYQFSQLLQKTNRNLELQLKKKGEIESRYKQLEKDYQSAEQKIELAGLSPALGNLLREQRRNLPTTKSNQGTFDKLQKEIALSSLKLFQLEEVKKNLADVEQAVHTRMEELKPQDMDETEKIKIRTEMRMLLNNQKELILKLKSVFSGYSRTLADVDFALHQLVSLGEKFSHFLDERLLWVPSAPVINKHYVHEIFNSIVWFSDYENWKEFIKDTEKSVQTYPLLAFLGLTVVFLQFRYRSAIKARLLELKKKTSSLYSDRFSYTLIGVGLVFLLALPYSLLLVWLGWLVQTNQQAAHFSLLVGDGLLAAALPMLIVQFFYQIFKPNGVVQFLFGWQDDSIKLIHNQIKWNRLVVIPAIFLIGMFNDEAYSEHSYSLGRTALIVILLVLTYVFYRFTHPSKGLAKNYYIAHPESWTSRLRYLFFGVIVLMPVVIMGFAIAGYYQSALELLHKLVILLRLTFFTVLLHEVIMRWMVLANRQLALQNARQKRKQLELAQAKEMAKTPETAGSAAAINPEEELLLDIPKINEQNKKLLMATIIAILSVGTWLTLRDIFPAFSIFEHVVMWEHKVMVEGQETFQPITLVNVFLCVLYLILMLVFVNNFSGLIDLMFVGRFSLTAGSRYALIQITRYIVITVTLIVVANELGGSWSQVQWLVAALGVGLGFGLQEIFANLVSGIILLFERPIRVGDIVTIGNIDGKVCRIQMRATTITDWDMKELIVPNKIFITEQLINWTLTDTITRIVIPVGVSYDADEVLVKELLKQVVSETPRVLKDPPAMVFFLGFGDSSLDFSVRVYVRELGDRLPVTDDIHNRIRKIFREHDIEIPFPQRDIHIRSSVASELKV